MNILIIDNSIAFTGAFKCAVNEAEMLSDMHQFYFLLPSGSSAVTILEKKSIPGFTLPMKEIRKSVPALVSYPFYLIRNALRLKRILTRYQIDVIQVNDFYNLLGVLSMMMGFRGKLLVFVRFLPYSMPVYLRKLWIGLALRNANKLIAVSDSVLEQLPKHIKSIRIYDPVSLKETAPYKNYNAGEVTECLYLANYTRGKGQEYAIEAFAEAYKTDNKLRLKITGGDMGLAKNVLFKEELIEKVRSLGLSQVISFHPFNQDVELLMKNADLFLNFSDGESFSMTCLEAAFYGTCTIASKCGGPEEIIVHNQTGILVNKKDVEAMTAAIISLAKDPTRRQQYGTAAKSYVKEKFSIERYKQQIENVLNS